MNHDTESNCLQCDGRGYLRIAVSIGAGVGIEMHKCLLCCDDEKWGYALKYVEMHGCTPPDEEIRSIGKPIAKILLLRKHKVMQWKPNETPPL